MNKYYAHIKNNELIDFSQCKYLGDEWTNIEVSEDVYLNKENYKYQNSEIVQKTEAEIEEEQLQKAKEAKIQEATSKAYAYEQTDALITVKATNAMTRASDLYHIEGHFTNMVKISAYAQSMGAEDILPWNTKENVNVFLNKTGCAQLSTLMQQMNVKLWTVDFPTYLAQIDAATTVDEVNAINIEYQNPQEVVDINIPPSMEEDSGADTEGDEPSASIDDEAAEEVINEDTTVE